MKDKKVIINRDAWHYPFVGVHYDLDQDLPKSECSYFWTLVFSLLTYVVWRPFKSIMQNTSFTDNLALAWFIWLMFAFLLSGTYGTVDIFFISGELDTESFLHALSIIYMIVIGGLALGAAYYYSRYAWKAHKDKLPKINIGKDEEEFSFFKNVKQLKRKICRPVEYRGD